MKNQLVLFVGLFVFQFGFSQTKNFWKKNSSPIENKNISSTKKISNQNTYHLSVEKLKEVLSHCPQRFNSFGQSNVIITLPTERGEFKEYRVKESSVLHPDLAKKFPDIKSYVATSVSGEGGVVHFSLGYNNFRAMIMKPDATITNIKPSTSNSKTYVVTSKTEGSASINCQAIDHAVRPFLEKSTKQAEKSNKARKDANDGRVRVYRMAIAVTGELSKIYTDKANVTNGSTQQRKAAVLAELNVLITRVNAIYERDLGTTFELVPNMDNSIFLDPVTDGFTHGNTSASVNEVQAILDAKIGNANYDIGHVLDSDGTGRGALRAVCVDSKKAEGATGAHPFTSVNDYFFVTFVHEIGHQFGANHSFNNSCGGNRLDEGAVEPGGGNTIMAYTGCAPNTANTQYLFFHAKQIDEMWNHIVSTAGCGTTKSIGNSAPAASVGGNYTIPRSTPFILEGSATDANSADQLTYSWNQMDKEIAPMPPRATSTNGPLFRYQPPTTSPKRYMPDLSTIKAGNASSEWEVTPSVSRMMNFRFTVRDNHPGGGNTDSKDAVITVSGNAGPFMITSQNTRFDAPVGSTQTVTWNVAGTTGNGVNAATVDILLSTDGGNTYPITLASAVPNDGSQQIIIPDNEGGVNRIMVRGTNNIFFDITNANFSITNGNLDPMPTNYCAAGYQGNNYIDEVIFGAINNKSENGAYSDFTNLGTNITKGESVALTINPGIDFWDPNYFGAWIDWNKDGDFEDAGEEVLLTTNGAGGVTTTVVVPHTAKSGATRLRVRYKIHTAPEPCGTARTNGDEVEDYFLFIKGGSSNPTCNDGIQNGNETGVDCGGPDCDPCTVDPTCNDGIQNGNETGVDCGGPDCNPCNTNVTYCAASTTQNATLHITNVSLGSINNSSTNAAYNDFTNQSTNLTNGQATALTITMNNNTWTYNAVGVWIDWNNNGDFTDSGEKVYSRFAAGPYTSTITPPASAVSGTSLRMRVRAGYGSEAKITPCGTDTYLGEVEDYTVTVGGSTSPTCTDGIQNGNETGVDCGGSCSPCATNGTVVYVDMSDETTNSSSTWNFFRIEVGDDNGFGAWFTNNSLRLVNYGKNVVCEGTTSNATFIEEGVEVGAASNFVANSNSFMVSSSSYTDWRGKSGYIGFTFKIGGNTHYGWFYATVANDGLSYIIKDYAYNTTADQGLLTKRPTRQKERTSENRVSIYPNPFEETVTIDVSRLESDTFTITVYNLLGKELINEEYSKNPGTILLGDKIKSSGNYFVKIQANKHTETLRLIKF
ncbi:putative secreted protein (Por secretion system target) [Aquimarina sp. MAR_2010_214]|uniref:zinc-dependent metalloprotease n=1 Tax=Aquimarina sp. MAR_2010_214 TaxID=1250026 RepID=UPI000C6FFBAA|nr:GEVED domain-containing protein [Aquimarina sp. MAR_2010_214]PKV51990.1 putative secreted protein (Por secretion system target) [Aquimarina sp. MAR_2010_214]